MKHLSAFFRPVTNALSAWSVGLHSFFSHFLISAGSLPQRNVSVTSASAAIVGTPSRRRRGLMLKPLAFILLFLLGSLNVWGADVTITFADLDLTNQKQYSDPFNIDANVTITFGGGANDGKYYDTGAGIRTYGGGTITIDAGSYTISEAAFTWDGSYKPGADNANPTGYSTTTGKWTGNASSFVLTRPSGSGHWRLKSVTVTYSGPAQSANSITPAVNGDSYGSVSLSGSVITATPNSGYRYADPAFSITPENAASVTQGTGDNINKFTVSDLTKDVTVTINFEVIPQYTVTWNNHGLTSTSQVYEGEKPEFPETPSSCDATSTTFIGWATAAWNDKVGNIDDKTVYTSASAMPKVNSNGTTYYAVFAKVEGSSAFDGTTGGDFYIYADIAGTKYYAKAFAGKIESTTDIAEAVKYTLERKVENEKTYFAIKSNDKYLGYGTSGTDFSYTLEEAYYFEMASGEHGSWRLKVTTGNTARSIVYRTGTTNKFAPYAVSGINGTEYYDIEIGGGASYSDYLTTCCTKYNVTIADGIANGSVSADLAKACEGETVTLTFTPALNYHLDSWSLNGADQDVDENTFAMPAGDVEVSAVFAQDDCTPLATPANAEAVTDYKSAILTWDEIANADKYTVYILTNEDAEVEHADVTDAEYTVSATLGAETTYKYTIQAVSNTPATHCPSVLAQGTFTTEALPTAVLTLMENGNEVAGGSHAITVPFALPTEVSHTCTKTFVGWTSKSDFADGNESLPSYYVKGAEFTFENTDGVTLYAVYADEEEGDPSTIFSEDFASCDGTGGNDDNWSGSIASNNLSMTDWNFASGNAANGCAKFGTGSKKGSAETPSISLTGNATLTFRAAAWNSSSEGTTLNVSATGATLDKSSVTLTKGAFNSFTVAISDATGSVKIKFEAANANNNRFFLDDVVVSQASTSYDNYSTTCTAKVETPTISGVVNNETYTTSKTISLDCETEGAAIYYSLDGADAVAYSGAIEVNTYGPHTLTAYATKEDFTNSEEASVSFTLNLPFASVSDLFTYLTANSLTSLNDVTVTGVVTEIVTEYSSQYYNVSFNIADDFDENSAQLQGYRTKDGSATAAATVAAGDQVTLKGNYTFDGTTHKLAANNTIEAYTAKVLSSVTISGTASKTNYSAEDNVFSFAGLTATANYNNTGYSADVTNEVTWKANEEETYTVTEGGNVNVTATLGDVTSDPKVVAVTFTTKTVKSIRLEYASTYTFGGFDLPKPKVYASYVENIPEEEVTELLTDANYDTESAYSKDEADTYTIKVEYAEKEAEYTVEVKVKYNNEGAPHTVADATAIINHEGSSSASDKYMWVRGKVVGYNGSNNNRYYISDDGTTTGQLYVYNGTTFGGETMTADNKPAVGDEVILKAKIQIFSSTNELVSSQIVYQLQNALPNIAIADVAELEVGRDDLDMTDLITKDGNGEVTLESSDESKLTVDGLVLHAVAAGDVTVTANLEATNNANSVNYKANSTTFTVHVIAARTRYSVTFEANGGTGTNPTIANQLENATVELPETNPYTKEGNKFMGWQVLYNEIVLEKALGESFTMPAADVTIKPKWEEVATCAISFMVNGAEVATANAPQEDIYNITQVGDAVNGFEFLGWSVTEVSDEVEELPTMITSYTPVAGEESKVLYGIYSRVEEGANYGKYEKVASAPENWSGQYLIVYENGNKAMDGSLSSMTSSGNGIDVTIVDGVVTATTTANKTLDGSSFTIANAETNYSIRSASGKYIGCTGSSNGFNESTTMVYTNAISLTEITSSGGPKLQCWVQSNNYQFKYYASSQNALALYKKNLGTTYYTSSPVEKVTITFDVNGGEGGCQTTKINKGSEFTICADEPTLLHSEFAGWNTQADGLGMAYAAGTEYTFSDDITLYAKWTPAATYTVTYAANGATGDVPTDATEYYAGDEVTVLGQGTLEKDGYEFQGWLNSNLYAEDDVFAMPAANVTLTAQWRKQAISTETMTLVTDVSQLINGSKVVIAIKNEQYNYLAGQLSTSNSKYLIAENTNVTFSGNEVSYTNANVLEWTLVQTENGWQLMNGDNYLGESGDNLSVSTTNATNWAIAVSANGDAAIKSQTYTIRFNPNLQSGVPSTPRFKTYGSGSNLALPQLYTSTLAITETENTVNISDLGYVDNDIIVVNNGVELNMNAPSAPASITVKNGATVAVNAETETNNLTVEAGGKVDVDENETLKVDNLYIQSNQGGTVSSSQIINAANLNLSGDAYFDITFANSAVTAGWYSFAVPFQVDVQNGIYNAKNGAKLTNESDYAVMTYQGDVRANGEYGWIKVHKKGGKLVPGQLYIIAFGDTEYNKIRFKKDAGATLNTSDDVEIKEYASTSGDNADKGWNGIGNSTLHYAKVSMEEINLAQYHAQYLNHADNVFEVSGNDISIEGYVVGSAFFVQAPNAGTMTFGEYTSGTLHAPARNEVADEFMLTISKEGKFQDRLFVSASETASNDYEIGHDLVKLGAISGAAKVAQIAVNGYNDINLCDAEFPLVNNQAIFPLVLTAPATGTYTIAVERYADADLYLTYQGTVIWNLTESPYDLSLMKGRTDEYGLLLNATGRGVSTGVEQQIEKNGVEKFVMNDQLYILHNGVLYNANGQKVK